MNEKFTNNINQEDTELAHKLQTVAEQTNANAHFMAELENKLKETHQLKAKRFMPRFEKITLALGWAALVVVFGLALSWSIRNLIPNPQPAANITSIPELASPTPISNTATIDYIVQANDTCASIADHFGVTVNEVMAVNKLTEPCTLLLGTVLKIPVKSAITQPVMPVSADGSYAWRNTKLFLAQPLPQIAPDSKVYALKPSQPGIQDAVLTLAQRFGIQGAAQELPPDFANNIGYFVTNGTQKLEVQANRHFIFYPNVTAPAVGTVSIEQAQTIIADFLKKYGFDFAYHLVESAPGSSAMQYTIIPLTPDGAEIRSDYLMPITYEFTIDGAGQVLAFSGFLLDYEALGTYQVITAENAFQSVLANVPQLGRMESVRGNGGGGGGGPGFYKLNLSGTPVPFPTTTPFPTLNTNVSGSNYIVQAGDTFASIAQTYGITVDELMNANNTTNPGTLMVGQPLIIPGAQAQNPYLGRVFENQRGIVMVNIYRKSDGSQRTEYAFITAKDGENYNLKLAGDGLQELEKYNNRPINIWAAIESTDQFGNMTAQVSRFEIPFPDLKIQIFRGSQHTAQINGQTAILFTTVDGTTYIQALPNGDPFIENPLVGVEGDEVLLEAINIPDDFNNGYPVLRTFGASLATSKNGQAVEMTVTADQPYIIDETPNTEVSVPPTLTIEKVELTYYLPNPLYGRNDQNADAQIIQPVWRFYGHYATGDEFEILVQALKREFLLPELAPYEPPG
ncbi:MAG: LysM domain-containing protein [Chloroflexota bacterium]